MSGGGSLGVELWSLNDKGLRSVFFTEVHDVDLGGAVHMPVFIKYLQS